LIVWLIKVDSNRLAKSVTVSINKTRQNGSK